LKEIAMSKKKKKFPLDIKVNIILGLVSSILSILALLISGWSVLKTNYNSQKIVEYQLEQERLPRLAGINCRLSVSIDYIDTYKGERIDFSRISQNLYPITIPIYNVGVGIAQNCEIEWNQQSIDNACAQSIDLLKQYCNIHEFERSMIREESGELWAYQDYIFQTIDGKYQTVRFNKYYPSNNKNHGYEQEDVEEDLICSDIQIPYLLPILNQPEPSYIPLSKGLSMLLLEIAAHKIEEPISFEFNVTYQDLTGSYYEETIIVTFLLNVQNQKEENIEFQISFET